MKELSIEEKAKRYDEAIERTIKHLNNDGLTLEQYESIDIIFPELKESKENEDEKIRKDIIQCLKHSGIKENNPINPHVTTTTKDAIAWLDKQGESYTKRDVDDAYLKGVTNTKKEIEKQYEANYQIRKDIATFIFNYKGDIKDRAKWMDYLGIKVSFAEKQGEKKSAWSEKDEERLQSCLNILQAKGIMGVTETINTKWLKSLKERYTWKPSDEQIEECRSNHN